ncbi:MAG: hypothetical protein KAJ97_02490 [Acidobacteria bacterium]|nr:hypothetical protein [Acidobacteriota bacterium]
MYVSTNDKGYIFEAGNDTPLLGEKKAVYGDLVLGPDLKLYGCEPSNDRVFRFDPMDPGSVEELYPLPNSDPGLRGPQCGWFTADGDLLVTGDDGVWVFDLDGSSGGDPVHKLQCVDPQPPGAPFDCPADFDFDGEGITQAANGSILAVDAGDKTVSRIPYDIILGSFVTPVEDDFIFGLIDPVGIARTSNGDIFVGDGDQLLRFSSTGGDAASDSDTCDEFPGGTINFVESSADDTLYVAVTGNKAGELWEIPFVFDEVHSTWSCVPPAEPLMTFTKKDHGTATLVGVAVSFSDRLGTLSADPQIPDGTSYFKFFDSGYEFTPSDSSCEVTIWARETDPDEVGIWIQLAIDSDPNIEDPNDVTGSPVVFLGDNGRPLVYEVTGNSACLPSDLYEHAINAFYDLVPNPRIGVKHSYTGCDPCFELIQLTSYFPFNGIFPDDGRIGGRGDGLSEFFLINVDLLATLGAGEFCGFTPPLIASADIDDPLPEYNSGSVVPIKFKVADLGADPPGTCQNGPFLTGVTAMLSVAKVRDGAGDPDFDPIEDPEFSGGYDPDGPPIFHSPNSPSTPYNLGLDTNDYEPGTYQIVVIALTDNFEVQYTYFKIKP